MIKSAVAFQEFVINRQLSMITPSDYLTVHTCNLSTFDIYFGETLDFDLWYIWNVTSYRTALDRLKKIIVNSLLLELTSQGQHISFITFQE